MHGKVYMLKPNANIAIAGIWYIPTDHMLLDVGQGSCERRLEIAASQPIMLLTAGFCARRGEEETRRTPY
jgi:hypothetical protein